MNFQYLPFSAIGKNWCITQNHRFERTNPLDIDIAVMFGYKEKILVEYLILAKYLLILAKYFLILAKYLSQNKRRDKPTEESHCNPKCPYTKRVRRDMALDAGARIITFSSRHSSVRPGTVTGKIRMVLHEDGIFSITILIIALVPR